MYTVIFTFNTMKKNSYSVMTFPYTVYSKVGISFFLHEFTWTTNIKLFLSATDLSIKM